MPDSTTTSPGSNANTGAYVAAGAQIASAGISAMAASKLNKKTMAYNSEWAYRQRQWAEQDRDFANKYNSPAEQRKRMIEANMNPALMYGGASSAPAAVVRGTQSPQANFAPVDFGPAAKAGSIGLQTFYDIKMQEQQLRNMEMQNAKMASDIAKNTATTQLTWDKSKLTQNENQRLEQILQGINQLNELGAGGQYSPDGSVLTMDASKILNQNRNLTAQALTNANENARRELYSSKNADQVVARISLMAQQQATSAEQAEQIKANTDLILKSGVLSQYQIDAAEILNPAAQGPATKIVLAILQKLLSSK